MGISSHSAGKGKRRKAALDWYGGPYDPENIDKKQVLLKLKRIFAALEGLTDDV
jgi:hypothetical protein